MMCVSSELWTDDIKNERENGNFKSTIEKINNWLYFCEWKIIKRYDTQFLKKTILEQQGYLWFYSNQCDFNLSSGVQ